MSNEPNEKKPYEIPGSNYVERRARTSLLSQHFSSAPRPDEQTQPTTTPISPSRSAPNVRVTNPSLSPEQKKRAARSQSLNSSSQEIAERMIENRSQNFTPGSTPRPSFLSDFFDVAGDTPNGEIVRTIQDVATFLEEEQQEQPYFSCSPKPK